jgi:hypothetical protein
MKILLLGSTGRTGKLVIGPAHIALKFPTSTTTSRATLWYSYAALAVVGRRLDRLCHSRRDRDSGQVDAGIISVTNVGESIKY